jgi:protein-S-isoprenylcysteine O-methyltransferase Ste14
MYVSYAFLRHMLLLVAIPITLVVLIPFGLAWHYGVAYTPPAGIADTALQAMGTAGMLLGAALLGTSLYQIARRGRDELAPWDPPRRLMIRGPYRRVRNPMLSGVLFLLFGEACLFESWLYAAVAAMFLMVSLVFVPLLEEPQLEARFGEDYRRYRRHVWRFLPRLRPWNPEAE